MSDILSGMEYNFDCDREARLEERRAIRLKLEEDQRTTPEKWRPFWQRGHKTILEREQEFIEKEKYAVHPAKFDLKRIRMYHSNMDVSGAGRQEGKRKSNMSKSVSVQGGLHHYNGNNDSSRQGSRPSKTKELLPHSSSALALPKYDHTVDVPWELGSRLSSAGNAERMADGGGGAGTNQPYSDDEGCHTGEEDVYLSDDDPEISRKNLDKAGDYIVEHDWILKENLAKEARKVNSIYKKVRIALPDEDPMDTIKTRLDEITMMVKPKAEYGNFIETIDPEQRAKIMKYKETDSTIIRRNRRHNWKAINRFRDAGFKVILLYRACGPRKKYLMDDKPDTAPGEIQKMKQKNVNKQTNSLPKSSLGMEMQLALMTQSDFRSSSDVKKITRVLRATKAFKHLFPALLEEQVARVVSYERYDDRRIVANQGRDPERFYYILTGKLQKVREYRLLSGLITRNEGIIEKGHTTDPKEMVHNWPREHHLVSKGQVEVLMLEKSDFLDLQHTCKGPPIGFLQQLDLFKEFPCEEFLTNPDAIDFRYYGQDKVIVKDTNRTPWIHVVKTGTVKVVRMQPVIDVQNDTKFVNQSREELGTCRSFSHAKAMLGVLSKQRKMKTVVGAVNLPEITRRRRPQMVTQNGEADSVKFTNGEEMNGESSVKPPSGGNSPRKKHKLTKAPIIVNASGNHTTSPRLMDIGEENDNNTSKTKKTTSFSAPDRSSEERSSADRETFLPPINDASLVDKSSPEFHPHGTYLTRERTEFDPVYAKRLKKEIAQRKAHLQLDVLKPGDIFGLADVAEQFRIMYPLKEGYEGLEHMDPQALASEAAGVTLVSDGAEIIKISKRFFLTHAQNNTMLKVETMQRDYMTTEEAKTIMHDKETWNQYKTVLMQRTVENLYRTKMEKA